MRLIAAGPFPPHRGGISQFGMKLADVLEARVQVSRVGFSRLYPRAFFPGVSQFDPPGGASITAFATMDSCSPLSWRRTRRELSRLGADAAVVQWWHPFFAPALDRSLPPEREVRRVAVCHNIHPHEGFPMGRAVARWFLGKAEALAVHSAADEERARALLPHARILRLFHPIYDQYLAYDRGRQSARSGLGYGDDERVILFFGLVRPYKGVEDLIEAFREMPGDCRLLLAGECYSGAEDLRKALEAPGTASRARWDERFVPDSEVWAYFRAADLVVLPYRSATQSGVAQIALSFGRPMVLTRTGGLPELIEEGRTGFLAEPGSPESLAGAISRALDLPRGAEMEERVAEVASRFGWDRYADSLLELIR